MSSNFKAHTTEIDVETLKQPFKLIPELNEEELRDMPVKVEEETRKKWLADVNANIKSLRKLRDKYSKMTTPMNKVTKKNRTLTGNANFGAEPTKRFKRAKDTMHQPTLTEGFSKMMDLS